MLRLNPEALSPYIRLTAAITKNGNFYLSSRRSQVRHTQGLYAGPLLAECRLGETRQSLISNAYNFQDLTHLGSW
jgi:hypothetical protein